MCGFEKPTHEKDSTKQEGESGFSITAHYDEPRAIMPCSSKSEAAGWLQDRNYLAST
jgi:hypothetical protein